MHRLAGVWRYAILLTFLIGSAGPVSGASAWQSKVDAAVLAGAAAGETEFIVFLSEQADLSGAAGLRTKEEKGAFVYQRLTETAQRTQPSVLATLDRLGAEHRAYWVANMIWVRGDAMAVEALARRPDVAHLYANPYVRMALPEPQADAAQPQTVTGIEPNLSAVGAPQVWAAGYTGQGAVIGGQDTGYQWDHPALKAHYRGWNGASADHNYNWHDAIHSGGIAACPANSQAPCDDEGHGTHTMGTMVGDDGGANQTGMAPGAKWIGCRNMKSGVGSWVTYAECYQWFIAPTDLADQNPDPSKAPDVINNSWGCPPSPIEDCDDPNVLLGVVDNVRAAGILSVHSAGNSGAACSSVNEPAAIYASSFTVGATDNFGNLTSFSSRGPVTVDGSGRRKPDISAPGSNVRSSTLNNSYAQLSGTSMAAPHVAGLAALLISAEPALRGHPDLIETVIEKSAVPRSAGAVCGSAAGEVPNNTYGWGFINAWRAYQGTLHHLSVSKSASAHSIEPGGVLTYTLTVSHTHVISPTTQVVLTDTLPLAAQFVSATLPYTLTGRTVRWDFSSLGVTQTVQVSLAVTTPVTFTGSITNSLYGATSDQVQTPATGSPVMTWVLPPWIYLPVVWK
jgi:serine protease AprX